MTWSRLNHFLPHSQVSSRSLASMCGNTPTTFSTKMCGQTTSRPSGMWSTGRMWANGSKLPKSRTRTPELGFTRLLLILFNESYWNICSVSRRMHCTTLNLQMEANVCCFCVIPAPRFLKIVNFDLVSESSNSAQLLQPGFPLSPSLRVVSVS